MRHGQRAIEEAELQKRFVANELPRAVIEPRYAHSDVHRCCIICFLLFYLFRFAVSFLYLY